MTGRDRSVPRLFRHRCHSCHSKTGKETCLFYIYLYDCRHSKSKTGGETDLFYLHTQRPVCSTQAERLVCFTPTEIPVCLHRKTGLFTQAERLAYLHRQRDWSGLHRQRPVLLYTGRQTWSAQARTDKFVLRRQRPVCCAWSALFLHRQRPVLFYIGRDTLRAPLSDTFLQRLKEGCRKPVLGV